MQQPPQITFRDLAPSPAVEALILKEVDKLERFHHRITSCRVVVEAPHRRRRKGRLHHVRVELTLPGGEVAVHREAQEKHAHENVDVAVRDAFRAVRRELKNFARKRRGEVKHHEPRARERMV